MLHIIRTTTAFIPGIVVSSQFIIMAEVKDLVNVPSKEEDEGWSIEECEKSKRKQTILGIKPDLSRKRYCSAFKGKYAIVRTIFPTIRLQHVKN